VLAAAAARPEALVIGVDPVAEAMAKSSRKAPANALFAVGAAQHPP
jgi:hypothetical protein